MAQQKSLANGKASYGSCNPIGKTHGKKDDAASLARPNCSFRRASPPISDKTIDFLLRPVHQQFELRSYLKSLSSAWLMVCWLRRIAATTKFYWSAITEVKEQILRQWARFQTSVTRSDSKQRWADAGIPSSTKLNTSALLAYPSRAGEAR